jgi:hypothetical protein
VTGRDEPNPRDLVQLVGGTNVITTPVLGGAVGGGAVGGAVEAGACVVDRPVVAVVDGVVTDDGWVETVVGVVSSPLLSSENTKITSTNAVIAITAQMMPMSHFWDCDQPPPQSPSPAPPGDPPSPPAPAPPPPGPGPV